MTPKQRTTTNQVRLLKQRIHKLELGLRIISTWATCDDAAHCSREKAMIDIRDRAEETLKSEE